jgi:hypothetical protein
VPELEAPPLPAAVAPRRVKRALWRLSALIVVAVITITLVPGLSGLRHQFDRASAGWIVVGCVL